MPVSKRPRPRPRVVVVGSANVDLTTFTDRLPEAGETLFGERFDLGFGGKGANQAVAAALCGARVDMVAHLGDDLFGPATLENFDRLGVGTKHVGIVKGVSSGVAPIFVESRGQNRIIVVKGANDTLTPKAVEKAEKLIKRADVLVLQLEIPLETVYDAVRLARKHNVPVILNPAPAAPLDLDAVKTVSYFVPNETEAAALTGKPARTLEDAEAAAGALLASGLDRVIVTLGEKGALVVGAEGSKFHPSYNVKSVDTSGAGDAFIGSFAVFLGEGREEGDALARASLYAALSTKEVGTQKSFVKRKRFEKEWKQCVKQQGRG